MRGKLAIQWVIHKALELMDIPTVLGIPRQCVIDGRVLWVRPMTMDALGIILAWLDDVLPGRETRKIPPKLSDEASQQALQSFTGKTLTAWLALRDHGFTFEQAAEVVPHPSDGDGEMATKKALEHFRLMDVLMSRRRTRTPSDGGDDVSETWWDKGLAELATTYRLSELANLTLDQFDWLCSGGTADEFGQFDLQAIQDDLPRRIALIEAAKAAGTLEVVQ